MMRRELTNFNYVATGTSISHCLETGDHKDLYSGMKKNLKRLSGGLIKQGAGNHLIPTEMSEVVAMTPDICEKFHPSIVKINM